MDEKKNTGEENSGYRNSGFFNTDEPNVRMFNKDTKKKRNEVNLPDWLFFRLIDWVDLADMTPKEKQEHPGYKATGGFLRVYGYKEAFRKAFEEAEPEDLKKTLKLPDFNYAIFEEISGISRKDFGRRLSENDFVQQEIARLKEKAEKIMKRIEELEKRKKVKG